MKKETNNKLQITPNEVEKAKKKMMAVSKKKVIVGFSLVGALAIGGITAAGILGYKASHPANSVDLNSIMYGMDKFNNFKVEFEKKETGENDIKWDYCKKDNKERFINLSDPDLAVKYYCYCKDDGYYDVEFNTADNIPFTHYEETPKYSSLYYNKNYYILGCVYSEIFNSLNYIYNYNVFEYKDGKYYKNCVVDGGNASLIIETENNRLKNINALYKYNIESEVKVESCNFKYTYDCVTDEPFADPKICNFSGIEFVKEQEHDTVNKTFIYTFKYVGDDGEVADPITKKVHLTIDNETQVDKIVQNDSDTIIIKDDIPVDTQLSFSCCQGYLNSQIHS